MKREEAEEIVKIIQEISPIIEKYPMDLGAMALIQMVICVGVSHGQTRESLMDFVYESWNVQVRLKNET